MEELRASEMRYRRLFETAQDGILIVDFTTGRIEDVNKFLIDLLGYSHDELVGKKLWEIGPVQDIAVSQGAFAELRSKGTARYEDLPLQTKDSRDIEVEFVSNVYTVNGKLVIQCNIRDITQRKQCEAALLRSEEQLHQSNKLEAVGRLAGGVAHDFNNLLSIILGSAEILLDSLPADDPLAKYAEDITCASQQAASLTRQLLLFSRKAPVSLKVVDLNQVVQETSRMLQRMIGEHIEVVVVLSAEEALVLADHAQCQQILLNLAANARDAMQKGGKLTIETATLELRADELTDVAPGHYVKLTVQDSGEGMPLSAQRQLFEPFFTTKDEGKGSGFGLSIIYGIVQKSGGRIFVGSKPGEGTTFKIYFPRVKENIKEDTVPAMVPDESLRGSETVLLVEDQSALRSVIREFLQGLGYQVLDASCPIDAIQMLRQVRIGIDLLLTDVVMPGMSGKDLAKELRLFYNDMPILYMSGLHGERPKNDSPGIAFLEKPFSLHELAIRIRELCKG